ncbi:hypothetical protein CR513_52275, partial [Mucuna pruriens]
MNTIFQPLLDKIMGRPTPLKGKLEKFEFWLREMDFLGYVIHRPLKGSRYVLMQDNGVITYSFKQLAPHEENYNTPNLEHHLYGIKFEVFSDHKSVKYLSD